VGIGPFGGPIPTIFFTRAVWTNARVTPFLPRVVRCTTRFHCRSGALWRFAKARLLLGNPGFGVVAPNLSRGAESHCSHVSSDGRSRGFELCIRLFFGVGQAQDVNRRLSSRIKRDEKALLLRGGDLDGVLKRPGLGNLLV